MTPGFQNKFRGETDDGLNWTLVAYFYYLTQDGRLLRMVIGGTTDGPTMVNRFGKKWYAGVLHDGCYRNQMQILHNNVWHPFVVTKEESDLLLKEALLVQGVPAGESEIIYLAVKECGQPSFDEDRKKWPSPPAAQPAEPPWVIAAA